MIRSVSKSQTLNLKANVLKVFFTLSCMLAGYTGQAQTTIMSPTVNDGGFESSPTTWNFDQNTSSTTSANMWVIGSTSTGTNIPGVVTGSNAAYITTNATGAPWAYSTGTSRISHMYKDITFPAGEPVVTMSFYWRGRGESTAWDNASIYLAPTTYSLPTSPPNASTNTMTGADLIWAETVPSSLGAYTLVTLTIPQSLIGNSTASVDKKLIITWKNDNGGGSQPPIAIDDITITSSCQPVTVTGPSNISSTGATLAWTAFTGATGYQVRYKLVSDPTTVTTWATPTSVSGGSTTTLAVSSLTSSSAYEYQVAAVGASCTLFSASAIFSTICSSVAIPQTEGFNTAGTTTFPTCWTSTIITPSANSTAPTFTFETSGSNPTTSPYEGTRMVKFNSYNNDGGAARLTSLPVSTIGATSVDVGFKWRFDANTSYNSGTYLNEGVQVQYSTNGGASWTDVGSLITRTGTSTAWAQQTITLPSAAAGQSILMVGLKFVSAYGDNQYLDSFSISATPDCVKPTSLTATVTSPSSASLVWVAPSSGGTPIGYEYVVSTSSATPATAAGTGTFVTTTSASIPSLSPLTTYYAFVRSKCSPTSFSDWTLSATFTTPCNTVTLTQFEGFNTSSTTTLPSCWSQAVVASASTPPALTFETSTAHPSGYDPYEGTRMVRFNSYSSQSGAKIRLISLSLNTTANTSVDVDFKWFESPNYSGSPNSVQVQYSLDGSTWVNAGSAIGGYGTVAAWKNKTVTLPAAAAGKSLVFVGFLFSSDYGDDCYMDAVRIRETPTCYPPTSITATVTSATSATLNWTAPSLGTTPPANYEYVLSTSSTVPTSAGTSIPGSSTSLAVTSTTSGSSLTANTTYYVYMRSKCSATDSSDWSEVTTFTTPCTAATLPYLESFTSTSLPSCWTATEGSGGASYHWQTGTADASHGVAGPQSGTYFAYLNVYNAQTAYNPYYIQTAPISLVNNTTLYYYYFLGADGSPGSSASNSPLKVQVSTNYGTSWTDIYTHTSSNTTFASTSATSNWVENNVNLSAYAGQTVVLRFAGRSNYGSGRCNMALDEVNVNLSAPTATNGERCGPGNAVCSVSSNSGVASPVFKWYISQAATSAITGQSGASLSAYPITGTTTFYVSEIAGGVESRRTAVTATVNPLPDVTATPSHVTCYNTNTGSVTTNVTSGTGTIGYSWNTTPVQTTADIINLYAGSYTVIVTDTKGCKDTATAVVNNANINTQVAIGTQPSNATICYSGNTSFTVAATGNPTLTYLWEYRTSSTGTFSTVSNGGVYSNATTATLNLSSVPVTMNGYQYRVTVSGPCGTAKVSNTVTLTVNQTNVAVSISTPTTTICAAETPLFSSNVTGGGLSPTYAWKKNGSTVATTATYTPASLALSNNDVISLEVNSNATCPNPTTAVSNSITMTVNPMLTPSVSIAASPATSICPGNTVTFTATPTNGGTPTYTWRKNGVTISGAGNGATYSTSIVSTGDVFSCVMNSTETCRTANTATSNGITMTVVTATTPTISIAVSPGNTVCNGTLVTYTATVTNEGAAPTYIWRNNGSLIAGAPNSRFYSTTGATNGDVITCEVISNKPCVTVNSVTSSSIIMTVNPVLTPSLTISATPDSNICEGTLVTFNANATNEGPTPTYQWRINGIDMASANASTYSVNNLNNGDVISCSMTTSVPCPSIPTISSGNQISIDVAPTTAPHLTISALPSERFVQGDTVVFVAVAANAGISPAYVWYRNGARIPTVYGQTYRTYLLNEGDVITAIVYSSDPCSQPDSALSNSITLKDVTGVKEMAAAETEVHLYPNPNSGVFVIETQDNFNVKGQEAKYEILSNVGQLVQRGTFSTQLGSFKQQVSTESMANGTYFIRVSIGDYQIMKRFVKQ